MKHYFLLVFWCTGSIYFAQKTKFVCHTEGTSISTITRPFEETDFNISFTPNIWSPNWIGDVMITPTTRKYNIDTAFIALDSGYYRSNTDQMLMLIQKEKYRPRVELITLSEIKGGRKRTVLPGPEPQLSRGKDGMFINVDQISMRVQPRDFRQRHYITYKDYLKNDLEHEYVSDRELHYTNTVFEKDMNRFLRSLGYSDSNLKLSPMQELDINLAVKKITEHKFGRFCCVEVECLLTFNTGYAGIKEKTYRAKSNIGYDDSYENQLNNKELIAEAINHVIYELLKDPVLGPKIKDPGSENNRLISGFEELVLTNHPAGEINLEYAANAVVTVLLKDGHGSGCVLSNDGYILTNFHVAGTDTTNIYALFNNGAKKRCRFVRGNPSYDLALLKADTLTAQPFKVITAMPGIGADVYAIGTPGDVKLGQSISKGIISGKRNMEGRQYIQSDASVNKGNSGGALTNKNGELIGVVNAKLVGYGVEGVSFAIPAQYIEEALKIKLKSE